MGREMGDKIALMIKTGLVTDGHSDTWDSDAFLRVGIKNLDKTSEVQISGYMRA